MSLPCTDAPKGLKESILSHHSSIHAFCKKYKGTLSRSTVYQVVSGRYPGNPERHIDRIKDILEGKLISTTLENDMLTALKTVACSRCKKKGRKACKKCNAGMLKQIKLLKKIFEQAIKGE